MKKFKQAKSILYVEDEKGVQELLSDVLEMFCETLYTADDGFQGLELFHKHQPDIVITDIKMPVMDGIEMAKKIKEKSADVPIVFNTAFSDVDYFIEAIELQADGYLLKPIDLQALEKKVLSIIDSIELKKELLEKEEMLIQSSKMAAMGEMIGNIAHQWRQPLSAISMRANNIKINYELNGKISNEESLEFADKVIEQSRYLSNTIDDFRSYFNPITEGEEYNLKEYLDKSIQLVGASFDDNMISIIQNIDEKINSYGDKNKLLQAIINILNNAKDALVAASELREKLVFIFTVEEDENNNIVIVIKDNAGGIPEKILPRIFEPYFTTKHKAQGTGLGLYITYTIVTKNLTGTIKAENEVFEHEGVSYKGAKFTITLPKIMKVLPYNQGVLESSFSNL